MEENIIKQDLSEAVGTCYIDYAMSVIISRALPDVRDGLKPVLRRILYAMYEGNVFYNRNYRKSARSVGDTMGKYHPHGDASIYEAMVNTAQDFKTRYPLIDGQGNFGSMDGDGAAAMRYTEARMSKIGTYMLEGIEKNTVDFGPNFDETEKEPLVLPTLIPNILVNGTQGIAVGMATNMLPHNLTEVYDALIYIIEAICQGQEPDTEKILEYIKGPDFPLGAQIVGISGIRDAYLTGKGKIKMRSVYHEEKRKGYPLIVFTELPYKINKLALVDKIDEVAKTRIPEIREVIDESSKDGVRITIEVKKDADINFVLARLFKYTDLEMSETINNLALVNGKPQTLTLVEILEHFLEHAIDVVRRENVYDLNKASYRHKIVQAILWAVNEQYTDHVVHIIRKAKSQQEAQEALAAYYTETTGDVLDGDQLKAIAEMRLRQLTSDNCDRYEEECKALEEAIARHQLIIEDDIVLLNELKGKFEELKTTFGDARRTEIVADNADITVEDLVKDETLILTYTSEGIIKTVEESTYIATNRGAKGVKGSSINEDEHITHLLTINSKDHLFFFTNKGKCMALRAFMIPKATRQSRGKYIGNYLPALEADEKVVGFAATTGKEEDSFFFLTTQNGTVKRLSFEDLPKVQRGANVITIKEGDELIGIRVVKEEDEVMITTDNAMSIRFKVSDVRSMGRSAAGIKGISLREGDKAVDCIVVNKEDKILTMTENGLAKRTDFDEYRVAKRGGVGILTHKLTNRTGKLVCALAVNETEELLIATQQGQIVRTKVSGINVTGRSASGVIALRLAEGDSIVSVSKLKGSEEAIENEEAAL